MTKELRFKAEKASLLLSLVMNGVKYTGGSLREVSMGTVVAVTQQQSIEAADRSWAESTARIVVPAAGDSWSQSGARICRTTPASAACNAAS